MCVYQGVTVSDEQLKRTYLEEEDIGERLGTEDPEEIRHQEPEGETPVPWPSHSASSWAEIPHRSPYCRRSCRMLLLLHSVERE